jgi:hypothetical protein
MDILCISELNWKEHVVYSIWQVNGQQNSTIQCIIKDIRFPNSIVG